MTITEFLSEYLDGTEEQGRKFAHDLDSVISRAIAEHEQSKWKRYPENKPEIPGHYMVSLDNKSVNTFYWDGRNPHNGWSQFVIAFRELPQPYQEGGEG